jgi:hypothetical protein
MHLTSLVFVGVALSSNLVTTFSISDNTKKRDGNHLCTAAMHPDECKARTSSPAEIPFALFLPCLHFASAVEGHRLSSSVPPHLDPLLSCQRRFCCVALFVPLSNRLWPPPSHPMQFRHTSRANQCQCPAAPPGLWQFFASR